MQAPLYRLFNSRTGDHFYTTSVDERSNAVTSFGYRAENIELRLGTSTAGGLIPLYRLYNPRIGDHFYTMTAVERDAAAAKGYRMEGIAGYVQATATAGMFPLYRLWNGRIGDHLYTASEAERDFAVQRFGYQFERIEGYGFGPTREPVRTVSVFYYNEARDRQANGQLACSTNSVLPVSRVIPRTITPIQDAINELIQGRVTSLERQRGFRTEFPNANFRLLGANLASGVLTLEFTEVPGFTSGGACRVSLLRSQIEKTARQFPEVREVRFLPATLFQP